jgi:hypothetical protein
LKFLDKSSNIKFMEIRPVGAEVFHADGWTAITKLIVAFHNFAKTPKKFPPSQGNMAMEHEFSYRKLF